MKNLIALTGACLFSVAGVFQASAQQLPNFGFDAWKGTCGQTTGTADSGGAQSFTRPGNEPVSWNGSSVTQKVLGTMNFETCFKQVQDGNTYVNLKNYTTFGNTMPAYLNLANTWVFVYGTGFGLMDYAAFGDGGTYGGIQFENTPDALSLRYRKIKDTGECGRIVAYLWNGTFISKVPSKVTKDGVYTYDATLENVDRVVLGRTQDNVEQKGNLIASIDYQISKNVTNGWQDLTLDLDYVEANKELKPANLNVILSASDYWTRSNLANGTSMDVDDVKFVYYSRLASLTIGGVALEGFSSEKYEYTVNGKLPKAEDVAYTLLGNSPAKTVDVAVNEEAKTLTLTVTNTNTGEGVADIDGKNTHVYTINYVSKETSYPGYLNIAMGDSQIAYNNMAQVTITDYKNGTCDFVMPNLSVLGMTLGDIALEDVTIVDVDGGKQYKGHVDGMSLMEGAITANVTLNGRISAEGVADMDIDVVWLNEGTEIPIKVSFASEMTALEEAKGYYYVLKEKVPQIEGIASTLTVYLTTDEQVKNKLVVKDVRFVEDEVEQVFGDIVLDGVEISGSPTDEMVFGGTIDNVALANGKTATAKFDERSIRHTDGSYFVIFTLDVEGVSYEVGFGTKSIPASVEDVAAAGVVVNGAEGKIVVSGFNGQVEVYALDGVKVAQTAVAGNGEIKLARGIYVVRAGNQAVKVAVK